MRESDPLTQYLDVVYDRREATTMILDTKPLPSRQRHFHRRPQTARPARPPRPQPTAPPRPNRKQRPQTARPDIGRRSIPPPASVAVNGPSKAQIAEQKHIRRRLDAFLIGEKPHGHRVFVGIARDDPTQNQTTGDSAANDATNPYSNTPLVFHTRKLRTTKQKQAFVCNFDPSERMINFNPALTNQEPAPLEETGAVAHLNRRLDRQLMTRKVRPVRMSWLVSKQPKNLAASRSQAVFNRKGSTTGGDKAPNSPLSMNRHPSIATLGDNQAQLLAMGSPCASRSSLVDDARDGLLRASRGDLHSRSRSSMQRKLSAATLNRKASAGSLARHPSAAISSLLRESLADAEHLSGTLVARRGPKHTHIGKKSTTDYLVEYNKAIADTRLQHRPGRISDRPFVMVKSQWDRVVSAVFSPSPSLRNEQEYDLVHLGRDIAKRPILLVNELCHVGALCATTALAYAYLRVAPAWIFPVSWEVDFVFFVVVTLGQYVIYRTRIDDMLAPFFLLCSSSVLSTLLNVLLYAAATGTVVCVCFLDIDPEDAFLAWLLGPRHAHSLITQYLPFVFHQVAMLLRLGGLFFLIYMAITLSLRVVSRPTVVYAKTTRIVH
ncbi:unnamed protein product [Aphanomyces euteiches]